MALGDSSAYFMKHPPVPFTDPEAYEMLEVFIAGDRKP
jgi:myo-inositol-1-phosphate synthase